MCRLCFFSLDTLGWWRCLQEGMQALIIPHCLISCTVLVKGSQVRSACVASLCARFHWLALIVVGYLSAAHKSLCLLSRVHIWCAIWIAKEAHEDITIAGPGFITTQLLNPGDQARLPLFISKEYRYFWLV